MLVILIKWIDALNERIGRFLCWSLPLMTAITLLVVFFAALGRGWVWLGELVVYMYGILFMVGAGYTLLHDGHVRVDVFYQRLSPRRRAWIDLLGVLLLLLPTCAVIAWFSFPYVATSWELREHSIERQGLPAVFLLKTCLLLMPLLVALQGVSLAAKSYLLIIGRPYEPPR